MRWVRRSHVAQVDPDSGDLTLECAGFNDRNLYPRQTPCDQDFLRKLARDTEPEQLVPQSQ